MPTRRFVSELDSGVEVMIRPRSPAGTVLPSASSLTELWNGATARAQSAGRDLPNEGDCTPHRPEHEQPNRRSRTNSDRRTMPNATDVRVAPSATRMPISLVRSSSLMSSMATAVSTAPRIPSSAHSGVGRLSRARRTICGTSLSNPKRQRRPQLARLRFSRQVRAQPLATTPPWALLNPGCFDEDDITQPALPAVT
jgi:hypothetical protein